MDNTELKRLDESIPTNDHKIIELYNKLENELLNPQPHYQRKLVWKKQHKYAFIETILLNYPFPEICIASSDMNLEKLVATEVVVDGQQRLTTIVEYIKGVGDFANQNKVIKFDDLSPEKKRSFLNYRVSVRDLKDIDESVITEIFQRINSTEYSLNTVEKNNALYGDGEIALFSKQLIDDGYVATEQETDIIVEPITKKKINDFFKDNKIFSENDIKRMYDFQYIMLLTSTILEGNYYSRSEKVDVYLRDWNDSFPQYQIVLDSLVFSIDIISKLNLSEKSYWYNKANMFSLIVELTKTRTTEIDISKLEIELLNLEDKVDIYFSAETENDTKDITEDEKKYFEFARHGSHEKPSREHRGKVIKGILESCTISNQIMVSPLVSKNLEYLITLQKPFAIIIPTKTGLTKGILDAVYVVREFLKTNGIHNYDEQAFGPDNKIKLAAQLNDNGILKQTEMSLYRSNGRGDYRMWFSNLNDFANENEELAISVSSEGGVTILNLSRYDYTDIL